MSQQLDFWGMYPDRRVSGEEDVSQAFNEDVSLTWSEARHVVSHERTLAHDVACAPRCAARTQGRERHRRDFGSRKACLFTNSLAW